MKSREVSLSALILALWLSLAVKVLLNLAWTERAFALALMLLSFALNTALKMHLKEPRSIEKESMVFYMGAQKYSMPSAHTQLGFTALALVEGLYPLLLLPSLALAVLTALSRLYLRRHKATEILAGGVAGYSMGKIGVIAYGRVFLG